MITVLQVATNAFQTPNLDISKLSKEFWLREEARVLRETALLHKVRGKYHRSCTAALIFCTFQDSTE